MKKEESLDKILNIVEGIGKNADTFVKLFSRLDPLATGRRSRPKQLCLSKEIQDSVNVYSQQINEFGVVVEVDCPGNFKFLSWQQDLYAIFTNLADNSLYWMKEKKVRNKKITVYVETTEASLIHIDYRDTGPGIDPGLIDSDVIFDPEFSTKPSGTGLGLAIAGEAANRNGLELRAFESDKGAWFRLQPKEDNS